MRHLEKLMPLAQILLRLGLAIIFIYHGYAKLFTQRAQWVAAFPKMGFPWYFAYMAGAMEFFGGCLLVVGLFTRLIALLLAGEMAVAIWRVHLGAGLLAVSNYQFSLAVGMATFALMVMGGGVVSLDQRIFKK